MESVDAMQAECDSLVQAYQYTEKRQVMAQRQLRTATELLVMVVRVMVAVVAVTVVAVGLT